MRVSLVQWILARPQLQIAMDPDLEAILENIQEPEREPVAQVVIESHRVTTRPEFEEGQSACLDQLFERSRPRNLLEATGDLDAGLEFGLERQADAGEWLLGRHGSRCSTPSSPAVFRNHSTTSG